MHKHYSVEEFKEWGERVGADVLGNIAVTAGMSDHDFGKTRDILAELPEIKFICLDVANGYQ